MPLQPRDNSQPHHAHNQSRGTRGRFTRNPSRVSVASTPPSQAEDATRALPQISTSSSVERSGVGASSRTSVNSRRTSRQASQQTSRQASQQPPQTVPTKEASENGPNSVISIQTFMRKPDWQTMARITTQRSVSPAIGTGAKDDRYLGDDSVSSTTAALEKEPNIENVVLGDLAFKTWYPSFNYPKEILAGIVGARDGRFMERLERLYVCKSCFRYTKELVGYFAHVKSCRAEVPGERVYMHSDGWSVWEVDGEIDTAFCQNLSLFAKLFLDNKSVFFDVTGFNYYLLVHTDVKTDDNQVVGFFSKEKMSWDHNNLACILIFPPWQRKGLGALLMGVSYEISRREGILGGPEKPISELGKKGYSRYWGGEISRFLLGCKESDRKKTRGRITVEDISKGTWITVEDCLWTLREMDVGVGIGKGKGEVDRVEIDKEKIRKWVADHKIDLSPVVDVDGFVEGFAIKDEDDDEDDDEDEDEEEDEEEGD